jgi:hypothetical protein
LHREGRRLRRLRGCLCSKNKKYYATQKRSPEGKSALKRWTFHFVLLPFLLFR